MNKLFVRLAASGALALSLGAPSLANSASIDTTGPDSTNTVTSNNSNWWRQNTSNWVGLGNWNDQNASSGDSWTTKNTKVFGGSGGTGDASNWNSTHNLVDISNRGGKGCGCDSWSGGNNNGRIFLTGPDSSNRISFNNRNSFNSETENNVGVLNLNHQNARSGDVNVSHNTVVNGGGGGSGNATNSNSTVNTVGISNSPAQVWGGSGSGSGNASISTTGPDSNNQIRFNNSSNTNLSTENNVGIANFNHQTAKTGDVNVSHNTVVNGVGGSGDASNFNRTVNNVGLSN